MPRPFGDLRGRVRALTRSYACFTLAGARARARAKIAISTTRRRDPFRDSGTTGQRHGETAVGNGVSCAGSSEGRWVVLGAQPVVIARESARASIHALAPVQQPANPRGPSRPRATGTAHPALYVTAAVVTRTRTVNAHAARRLNRPIIILSIAPVLLLSLHISIYYIIVTKT